MSGSRAWQPISISLVRFGFDRPVGEICPSIALSLNYSPSDSAGLFVVIPGGRH